MAGALGPRLILLNSTPIFCRLKNLFNLAAAALRLFDRYGERKARMKARMKFLVETMGWEAFRAALDEERERVGPCHFRRITWRTTEEGSVPEIAGPGNVGERIEECAAHARIQADPHDFKRG